MTLSIRLKVVNFFFCGKQKNTLRNNAQPGRPYVTHATKLGTTQMYAKQRKQKDCFTSLTALMMVATRKEFKQKTSVTGKLNGSRIEVLIHNYVDEQVVQKLELAFLQTWVRISKYGFIKVSFSHPWKVHCRFGSTGAELTTIWSLDYKKPMCQHYIG